MHAWNLLVNISSISNILEDEINIETHPKYVKAQLKGRRLTKRRFKMDADLFKHDPIKFSFIPPKRNKELY